MDILETAKEELNKLEHIIGSASKSLMHLPKGKLSFKKSNDKEYYYRTLDGERTYVGKSDNPEVLRLKDRHFLEIVQNNAQHDRDLLDKLIKGYKVYDPNLINSSLPEQYADPSPQVFRELGFIDEKEFGEYKQTDPTHAENLKHSIGDGMKVRSKSELAIYKLYEAKEIPTEYERPLVLPNGFVLRPDFTIWSRSRRDYIYHEHVGMLSDNNYVSSFLKKFEAYCRFGYYPYSKVLYTFDDEDGSLDIANISRLIDIFMR